MKRKKLFLISIFFSWLISTPSHAGCLKTHSHLYNYKGKYVKKSDKYNTKFMTPSGSFNCNELIGHSKTHRLTGHNRDENASARAKLCDNGIVVDNIWEGYQLKYIKMYLPKKENAKSMVWKAIPVKTDSERICTSEGEKYILRKKFILQTTGKDEIVKVYTRERKITSD